MRHGKSRSILAFLLVAIGLQFLGCGKKGDDLYQYIQPAPKSIASQSKVLEFIGPSKLDIVWIIDNSGSMGVHQKAVIDNAEKFMQEFDRIARINWQMGVISTDESFPKEYGFDGVTSLARKAKDNVTRFKKAVSDLGTVGSGTEKVFVPVQKLLRDRHTGFVSKNSYLVLIMVTDAPEQSRMPAQDFLDWLKSVKPLENVRSYGILSPKEFRCQNGGEEEYTYPGSPYEGLIKATQGEVFSLCDPDFGKNLAKIGRTIADLIVTPRILLNGRPRPSTIEVFFEGVALPRGAKESGGVWMYDAESNMIHFHDVDFLENAEEDVKIQVKFVEDDGHGSAD